MKLTKNIKLLIILIFCAYLIDLSNCLQSEALLKNSNSNSNSNANKAANSNTNTAAAANSNQAANNLVGGIFSMKHKKMRVASKATTSSQTNLKNKAAATSTAKKTQTQVKTQAKTQTQNQNQNKQPMSDDLMGANSDLLKQTNLLATAMAAGQKPPGQKKKIELDKMGPIAFHSWVKFFKYKDQVASDRNAKLRFNQSRKFLTNGEFREQLKLYPGEDYQEKGDDGEFKYVSDPQKFYMIAFKNLVVFYSSKIVNKIKNK